MTDRRFEKAEFAAWGGIAGILALAVLKGIVGIMAQSSGLIADAAHSASGAAGSIAERAGFRAARPGSDDNHIYGHNKTETIASVIVSVFILVVGAEIAVSAVKALWNGAEHPPKSYALIAIVISLAVNEILYYYKRRLGKSLGSRVLLAQAETHRSSVYSSLAASLGVLLAVLGSQIALPALFYLDSAAGLFISLLVLRMGYRLLNEAVRKTVDRVLHREDAADLIAAVQRIKGVITVDDLRAREHGHYVVVDAKISVNPRISVLEGHDIARNVKQQLMKRFIHVADVFVHVNPYDPGYPYKNSVESEQGAHSNVIH